MKPEQLGPYRILHKLGQGGMGTVFEGVDIETNKPAAIKVLSSSLFGEENFRSRFHAEIETLRRLDHPNIVRLFGFGLQDERLFYAMELVTGTSLDVELRKGRRFYWQETSQIIIQTCTALRHAHDRGIVHRDIKPANILLTDDGVVKLSDFGIAKLFGNTNATEAGSVIGTAEYMSPEQADGRPVGNRSDLYSLGCVAYTLLANRPPFVSKSVPEMLQKQRFAKPDSLSGVARQTPKEIAEIIEQLLEKDPDKRIPTATALARRLEATSSELLGKSEISNTVSMASQPSAPNTTPGTKPLTGPKDVNETCDYNQIEIDNKSASSEESDQVELPQTLETSSFKQYPVAIEDPPTPKSHFTPVSRDELDPVQPDRAQKSPLVSFQTWMLLLALIGVALSVWAFLQPPSADELYGKILQKTSDKSIRSLLDANKDIEEFFVRFPGDSRCDNLREFEQRIQLYKLERKLQRRLRGVPGTRPLLPIERQYLEAISLIQLDRERCIAKLQAMIDLYHQHGEETGPTGQCVALSKRRLADLKNEVDEQAAADLALIRSRLEFANQIEADDKERATTMRRAVIRLYQNKPWAEAVVMQAREALKKTKAVDARTSDDEENLSRKNAR